MRCFKLTLCVVALATGCSASLQPTPGGDDGSSPDGGGTAAPLVNFTAGGSVLGPTAVDTGSAADFVDTRSDGVVTDSVLRLSILVASAGFSAELALSRFNTSGVTPIASESYTLSASAGTATPDGILYPLGTQRIVTLEGAISCFQTRCDGVAVVLRELSASRVAGMLSGTLLRENTGLTTPVELDFDLPTRTYLP